MYNNPYNFYPYMNTNYMTNNIRPRPSLLKGFSNIKWGDVLNNTQKTLNVINQAIPVYYQIKPIFSNVRSLGRLVSAFNDNSTTTVSNNDQIKKEANNNAPTFFIN